MPKSTGSSLKIIFVHFFTISVFWLLLLRGFLFLRNFHIFLFFFYFTRSMKIITGRRHWVLTEESPRLTKMDDNNTLVVFAWYFTRSLFPLPAFLNDVAGIHPGLIKLNETTTPVLEFFLTCIVRDSLCYNTFVTSPELSCHQKPISNSKLTNPSASSGSPRSREMTDTQPGLKREYLESATVT